ncbi:MAG TPA: DNA/RNA-binding winged helix domain-containing protein [Candidatus Cloacimonadota bacterium]|nr:DNA/RNA-binding winged helix domain-containing protein [Candidatus Cloacimonadota bacterium]
MNTQTVQTKGQINEQLLLENKIAEIAQNSKWFPIGFEKINSEIARQINTQKRQSLEQIIARMIQDDILVEITVNGYPQYYYRQNIEIILSRLLQGLESYHKEKPFKKGISCSEIRKYLSFNKKKKKQKAISGELLDFVIEIAAQQKLIILQDKIISLTNFRADESKKEMILNYIAHDNLVSRIDKEIMHQEFKLTISEFNSIIFDLKNEGKILTIQMKYFMSIQRFEEAKQIIVDYLEKNGVTHIRELMVLLNSSRRPTSIFLDYLDSLGILKLVDGKRDLA